MEQAYQFLQKGSDQQYETLIVNYLSLGQFELARACIAELHNIEPERCLVLLKKLITSDPPTEWLQSKSVPSTSHLIWLCLVEYKKLSATTSELDLPAQFIQQLEFDVLLDAALNNDATDDSESFTENVIHELRDNFEAGPSSEPTDKSLSSGTLSRLRSVAMLQPGLGTSLTRALVPRASRALVRLTCQLVTDLLAAQHVDEAVQFTALLNAAHRPETAIDSEELLGLFKQLIALYGNEQATGPWRQRVYSALLSHCTDNDSRVAVQFARVEDELIARAHHEAPLTVAFEHVRTLVTSEHEGQARDDKAADEQLGRFWRDFYHVMRVTNQHALEFVLSRAVECASASQFEQCAVLLRPFERLKPLVLLMVWDKFENDVEARVQLINTLWHHGGKQEVKDKDVALKCDILDYTIRASQWTAEQLLRENESELKIGQKVTKKGNQSAQQFKAAITNAIYNELKVHSVAFAVQSVCHRLSDREVWDLIAANPDHSEISAAEQLQDTLLFRAYFVVKSVMTVFDHVVQRASVDQTVLDQEYEAASVNIANISDPATLTGLAETLLAFVFLKRSAWQTDAKSRDLFVATPALVKSLLDLASQCLTRVKLAHDTSLEFKSRFEELQQFTREFKWRYELIASLRLTLAMDVSKYYGSEAKNRHFVNLLLASPATLLIMCIREKDFVKGKAVIDFFNMTARDTELARLAEEFNNIITKIGNKVDKSAIGELLSPDLSPTDTFNVCADFALTRAQTREQSVLFIDHAAHMLQQMKQGDSNKKTAKKGNVPSHLMNFENYIARIKLLQTAPLDYPQKLRSRVLSIEFFPVDVKALKAFLGNRMALRSAVSALFTATKDPTQRAALDSILRRVNMQLGSTTPHELADKIKSHAYVQRIVRHLLLIGDALSSDKFFGTKDYSAHLQRTPAQILAELVFKSRNYEQAEDLATELGLELTAVILSHLEADRTGVSDKKSSAPLNKSLPRQSSLPGLLKAQASSTTSQPRQFGSPSYGQGTSYSTSLKSPSPSPSSFLSSSFSAHDSHFEDADCDEQSKSYEQAVSPRDAPSGPGGELVQPNKYHLDIDVINYVAKQSPLLASLASLLRSPTSRFDPEFLETALSRSRRYPSLFNWICSRARTYGVFRAIFLQPHPSYDGLAKQLDPNNYAFLNLDQTKKGSRKSRQASRQSKHDDENDLSKSLHRSGTAFEDLDDAPSPSPSPSASAYISKSLKSDGFRGPGHKRMKSSGEHFEGDWPPSLGSVGPGERFLTFESVNYIRPKDQKYLDTIFNEDDIRQEQEFYSTLLDKMVLAGAHEEAIRLADATMPQGAPDFLLRLVVERAEDKTRVTEYLLRMQDKKQSTALVLQHLNVWPLETGLDLLYMCKCHSTLTPGDALLERIDLHYNKLQLFKEILSDANNADKWKRWQQLEQWCLKDPVSVIKHLLLSAQFDLAARVATQFRVTSMKKEIEEQFLLHLLNDTHDIARVRQRLAAMGPESIAVAESLLDHVKQPETIMFLIQYLMEYKNSLAAQLNNNALINGKELGIKVLVLLPPALQKVFKGLLNQPLLVIESLLMSEQTSTLVPVFREIPQIRNDELIVEYANKALEVPSDSRGPAEYRQWVLDENNADSLRKQHSYPSAPNHVLATALLDLCYDAKRVAKWCVDGAAKLSTFAFGTSSNQASNEVGNQLSQSGSMTPVKSDASQWTKAEAMSAVSHLLYYAKVRLSRESESLSGDSHVISMTEMIDMTLSRLDLLRRLILLTGIDRAREDKNGLRHKLPFNLDLNALNDPVKARQLRDELIEEDRMDEAIEVANKCNVEREPVWAAWGLALLKMGKYEQAKEKFKYSLMPQELRRTSAAPPVNRALLTRIITVLESDAPLDSFSLRQKFDELSQRLASKSGTKKAAKTFDDTMSFESYLHVLQVSPQKKKVDPSANSARNPVAIVKRQLNLDSVRYMQCIYYLQNYGTPNDLLSFWLRHQLLEDACRYVLSYSHQQTNQNSASDAASTSPATSAGTQLFIDLVLHTLAHNKLKEFKDILLKIDPQLGKWQDSLLATCRYFMARKEGVLLLEFQVLMRDFVRAGLTCIKLFERTEDVPAKISYLNLAKQHLQQGLEEYQSEVKQQGGTVSINSNILGTKSVSDIHRYIKTINLQLEVAKFMQSLLAKNKSSAKKDPASNSNMNQLASEPNEGEDETDARKKKKQKNSLFGTPQAKSIIAERMLVEHNFDLGFKIVQEFHLPMARIYNNALLKLSQSKQTKFVNELLKSIKPFLNDDEWDPILSAIVQVYAEQNQDPNTAEKFATNIKSEESKALALVTCGKLKTAYLAAIKTNNLAVVVTIRDEAKKRGAKRELELCEKFIATKVSQGVPLPGETKTGPSNNNN